MNKYLLIILSLFSLNYAQTYCAGDQVSSADQNAEHVVGAGTEEYSDGSMFKLSDWNGDLYGGHYNIIYIEMAASW